MAMEEAPPASTQSCPSSPTSRPPPPPPPPPPHHCLRYLPLSQTRPPGIKELALAVFSYNPHTQPLPLPANSDKARQSAPFTDHPSQPMSANSDPRRRAPRSIDLWDDNSTIVLLTHFLGQWQHAKNGNLRMKDWEKVTLSVNQDLETTFNVSQVRNRVDTIRKAYRKESQRVNATGGAPSSWPFYTFADRIWGKSPKVTGLPGGFNGETFCDKVESHTFTSIDMDDAPSDLPPASHIQHKASDEKVRASPKMLSMKMERIIGKKAKTSRWASSIGLLGKEIKTSMKEFTESMEKMEEKRMEFEMRMYEMRLKEDSARQEKQYEMRLKEETIRQEKQLAAQIAIAKLFSEKQHQESASSEG